jgi:hypothetical protein
MYTNIPKHDIINIISNIIKGNPQSNENVQKEILYITQTIMEQNYFQFNQQYYKQTNRVAMGAPTSAVLPETYIRHMEHTQIYPILVKQQIIGYFRYVDDILLIYDQNKTNIEQILNEFNKLQPTIKFTIEKELHESVNFLDLTIHREEKKLLFSINRKPIQTVIIIPSDSCYPYEHKFSSINNLLNRAHSCPITKEAKEIELNTIRSILLNNRYNINESNKHPKKRNAHTDTQQQTKWATFT